MNNTAQYLPNKVYDTLRDDILYCHIKPGSILSEIETAKQFNVSRTPVRDAFRRLQAEGLLEVKPHIGTFVTLIDLDQILNTIFVRKQVELGVIHELMDNFSETKELSLKMIVAKQKELLQSNLNDEKVSIEFMKLDDEFHKTLYKVAGRKEIWYLTLSLLKDYQRFRAFIALSDRTTLMNNCQQHQKIIELIVEKDKEKLDELFHRHLMDGIRHATPKILEHQSYFANLLDLQNK